MKNKDDKFIKIVSSGDKIPYDTLMLTIEPVAYKVIKKLEDGSTTVYTIPISVSIITIETHIPEDVITAMMVNTNQNSEQIMEDIKNLMSKSNDILDPNVI